ncbi:MAG: alpha/beta fold hydrolase [Flavobacteriaceae bacterium]|nr:alpha/beta fold hydrolase [Flavobacteriaceae bacterium]
MLLKSRIIGQGPSTLIILHGFLGMSNNWKSYAKKIRSLGFQIHLLDQRNHGNSFHSNEFNYKILAEDLKFYIDFHKIKIFSLIGHSMGGKTAMMFSNIYPYMLNKLIIVDILPIFYKNDYVKILKSLKSLNLKKIGSRINADKALKPTFKDPYFRAFLLQNLYRVKKEELAFKIDLDIILNNLNEIEKALPSNLFYEGKTLFIKGKKSDYINDSNYQIIDNQFPNSKIVEISNAGHWVHADNLNDFVKQTVFFLKS